jgi:fumarate hydratase class II
MSLEDAALASGKVTKEQFESIVNPLDMVGSGVRGA